MVKTSMNSQELDSNNVTSKLEELQNEKASLEAEYKKKKGQLIYLNFLMKVFLIDMLKFNK